MASRLETLVQRFATALNDSDFTYAESATATVTLGTKHLSDQNNKARFVVRPTTGSIKPTKSPGGGKKPPDEEVRANIRFDRGLELETFCFGRSWEETENLLHAAINAWRDVAVANKSGTGIVFGDEEWISEIEETSGIKITGPLVKFSLTVDVKVYGTDRVLTVPEEGFANGFSMYLPSGTQMVFEEVADTVTPQEE
jgi:hypothetical protein